MEGQDVALAGNMASKHRVRPLIVNQSVGLRLKTQYDIHEDEKAETRCNRESVKDTIEVAFRERQDGATGGKGQRCPNTDNGDNDFCCDNEIHVSIVHPALRPPKRLRLFAVMPRGVTRSFRFISISVIVASVIRGGCRICLGATGQQANFRPSR